MTTVEEVACSRQCLAIFKRTWPSSCTTRRGAFLAASLFAIDAKEGGATVAMVADGSPQAVMDGRDGPGGGGDGGLSATLR